MSIGKWLLAVLGLAGLELSGCGGDSAVDAVDADVRAAVRDGDVGSLVKAAAGGDPGAFVEAAQRELSETLAQESRPLPYPRRLREYLPGSGGSSGDELGGLEGYPVVEFSMRRDERTGNASAEGRYREEAIRWEGWVQLEIAFYGKELFGQQKLEFGMFRPQRDELRGFDLAYVERREADDDAVVRLKVADGLLVTAQGDRASIKILQDALGAVALEELERDFESGALFEPSVVDRMAQALLDSETVEELIPRSVSTIECQGISSERETRSEEPTSSATGTYPFGNIEVTDYVTPARASMEAPHALGEHAFVKYAGNGNGAVSHATFEHGALKGVLARVEFGSSMTQFVIRGTAGRIVVDIEAHWQKGADLDDESVHPALREQIAKVQNENGVGVFGDGDALVTALLEALDHERLQELGERGL